jgi:uncharacterized protein GlcG (DUF336 family)
MLSVKRLSIADAYILIEGARQKSIEIGVPMCIAVADDSGNLIAFERMDGGKAHSILLSQDKAYTAGAARKSTQDYNAVNVPGNLAFGIHTEAGGRISTVGGGIPVVVDGECVGGIGVSGSAPSQDVEVAQAGLDFFNQQ